MAEQPLFQNTDEQEAAYAPQETADDRSRERALVEEGTTGENRVAGTEQNDTRLPIPGPGMSAALHPMGNLDSANTSPIGVVGSDDDDTRNRD
jgi:hypothetical protein